MENYRHLTEEEVGLLKNNACIADDWGEVWVKEGFNPKRVFQARFSGVVKLGRFEQEFVLPGGICKKAGVRYSTLHNVVVGDNSCIENVQNYIANYEIGENTYIKNVGLVMVDGLTSFGEGVKVSVMNETGGREVAIHSKLSAHQAYISALYRHRPILIEKMGDLAEFYAKKHSSNVGKIGNNVVIVNAGTIKNVRVGDYCTIEGASRLENGSINSNKVAPVHIGSNVTCEDFIVSSGAYIDDGVLLSKCFVGQACFLSRNYSASESLFFSNCHGENGEACSVFAGPYTVTHHKSTLLIAGMFSFMNAGSGSNQNNHMYKLGPIHHGILERGSKTSSDSYILFPTHIGPFSLIMGRHVDHIDTSNLPFSYLIEQANTSYVMPGVNLRSVGTIRDVQKWPKRDKRTDSNRLDYINFNLLSPYTIQKMMNGVEILRELQRVSGEDSDVFTYRNAKIKNSSLRKGLQYYDIGIRKFLGNSIIKRLEGIDFKDNEQIRKRLRPDTAVGTGEWIDLSGLIAPKSELMRLVADIEEGRKKGVQEINDEFKVMADNYYVYEWTWAYSKIAGFYGVEPEAITSKDIISIVNSWREAVVSLDKMVYDDAKKEFSLSFMTGFGADGDSEQQKKDFEQVRGDFNTNPFVEAVLRHIEVKTALGEELICRMNEV